VNITVSREFEIVELTENVVPSKRDMLRDIDVQFSPFPPGWVIGLEVLGGMSDCITPCFNHGLLLGVVPSVGKMDVVEDSLLHLMEGDEAHFGRSKGLHQVIELIHEHLVYCGLMAR
jgi:hypothetical protein